ncbi:MAG: redoxin domain-containing protein [Bacteroidetes bacterium]|nr:redoxin domain-containing protein [Bacteroidota bacterium]
MIRKNLTGIVVAAIILTLLILLLTGKIVYPVKSDTLDVHNSGEIKKPLIELTGAGDDKTPDIKNNGRWINSEKELTLDDLRGKVVLIEFWTFGCYNCTNTLPYLKQWYEKYKSQDFKMIGIHCPEFDNERNFDNVSKSVEELGIKYPVLTDNDFSVWRKFDVHAWPTIFLIDKSGEIRYKKVGEGKYETTENKIIELLSEKHSSSK